MLTLTDATVSTSAVSILTSEASSGLSLKTKNPFFMGRGFDKIKATTYSPACYCSTISAGGLNFSVRNGKR